MTDHKLTPNAYPARITSTANPLVKDVRRAISRGGLTDEGWCIAETFHLLEEALRSDVDVAQVLVAESAITSVEPYAQRFKTAVLPDSLFQSISGTEAAQGVMVLVKPRAWTFDALLREDTLIVVMDELQDPGNAGTIVRAAEAFGASGIIFPKGAVSPFNPKTLRASAGSLFRVPLLHGIEADCVRSQLLQNGVELFAASPAHAGAPPADTTDLRGGCAFVIGNEARGVSSAWRSAAREVSIPTTGVESLNAAVAAGILLYEARRQRRRRP